MLGCSGRMLLLLLWTTFVGTFAFAASVFHFIDSKLCFVCCLDYFCVKILTLKSGCRHHLLEIQTVVYLKNLITKFTDVINVHDGILH